MLGHRYSVYLVIVVVILLSGFRPAFGQGFMVKPMKFEMTPRPGESVVATLEIRNTSMDGPASIEIFLVEMTQSPSGPWSYSLRGQVPEGLALSSCVDWTTIARDEIAIGPASPGELAIKLDVPATARGVYFAGILARAKPKNENASGIKTRMQFLVPIIVDIKGPTERQNIEFGQPVMIFDDRPGVATTKVEFPVQNHGRTFPRVAGIVKIMRQVKERWRPVAEITVRDVGIIPGVALDLAADLERRLPSGQYKLALIPQIDGRRLPAIEHQISFVGDPTVDALTVDCALSINPGQLEFEVVPGASRSLVLEVENGGEDPVTVAAVATLPTGLAGVSLGEVNGHDLDGSAWLKIVPETFKLRPGRRQNIRLTARTPDSGLDHAFYYSALTLKANYEDGQSGGETPVLISVRNQAVDSTPQARVARVTLAADGDSRYLVQARAENPGSAHFSPRARVVLLTGFGNSVLQAPLGGSDSPLLPLMSRSFSGILDLASIDPGDYVLRALLAYGDDMEAAGEVLVHVEVRGGDRVVTVR